MTGEAYARSCDAQDPLAAYKADFFIADPELIYLDGNSLGRLPQATLAHAQSFITEQWGERLIRSWNEGWFEGPERVGAQIAELIGAQPDEVIVADSTTVNLFKLMVAALKARPDRKTLLTDNLNFPSDIYVMQGVSGLLAQDHRVQVLASEDGIYGPVTAIKQALNQDTALVSLSHTVFKSGYVYDMADITQAAHEAGALTLWDLSHSVGSVEVDLGAAQADLAVGCTYKYLNGGPGSPAFIYIRRDLQSQLRNPISGWMGQYNLFDFALDYEPHQGIRRFLTGTPAVAGVELLAGGTELLRKVGMPAIREKSLKQTSYLIDLWESRLQPLGFSLNTPRDPKWRGSHISLGHEHGLGINLAMIKAKKIIPDFRPPDNIRLGIAPLYTSFYDIYEAVCRIEAIMVERLYEQYSHADGVVT